MGKFFAVLILLASFRASIWAAEVEFDLSCYKTKSRTFNFEEGATTDMNYSNGYSSSIPIESIKGNSPFGIKQNVSIFFGNQKDNLFAVGLGIDTGCDFGKSFKFNDTQITYTDKLSMGMYFALGPSIRIKPVSFLSLHIQPSLGFENFFTYDRYTNTDYIYDVIALTFNCDFGAKLWLTKHFGFNAGVNFSKHSAGAFVISFNDNNGTTGDGSCLDLNDGLTYRFYVGVSWGWGKR